MISDRPAVIPMIAYENGPAAMDWLARAFGFRERERRTEAGRLTHGEMVAGGGLIMMATPSPHYRGPKRHRETCAEAAKWQEVPYIVDGLLVYVDDVESHFETARAAGATMLSPVETTGDGKRYRVEDIEGHRWMFIQR